MESNQQIDRITAGRKKYIRHGVNGDIRYTVAGHRVETMDDVKIVVPIIRDEYGVSKREAKRIAHQMLHAEASAIAEPSKRAVKARADEKRRSKSTKGQTGVREHTPKRHRMRWAERTNRDVKPGILVSSIKVSGSASTCDATLALGTLPVGVSI